MKRAGPDRVAAVAGMLFAVAYVVGDYIAPELVYPEEQVGGVVATFYANFKGRLLAQAALFGVASLLFLVFLGGLRAFLARAEGGETRLASAALAAGAVAIGLVLLRAATLIALIALREDEVSVKAEGSVWAARALFHLEGALGNMALFPLAALLVAAAVALLRARVLPRWLALAGGVLALVVVLLAVGSVVGMDLQTAGQAIVVLVLVWLAVLAFCLGWPLPSAAGRANEALE